MSNHFRNCNYRDEIHVDAHLTCQKLTKKEKNKIVAFPYSKSVGLSVRNEISLSFRSTSLGWRGKTLVN